MPGGPIESPSTPAEGATSTPPRRAASPYVNGADVQQHDARGYLRIAYLHAPLWQVCPGSHFVPQLPQFHGSVAKFTQDLPHITSVDGQLAMHVPWEHSGADEGQTWLQAPQLFSSSCRLRQTPPQSPSGALHELTQMPDSHA